MTSIAVYVFPDAEELDFVGPWEVLSSWATGWPDDGVSVFTVADLAGEVRCAKGLCIIPDHSWDTAPQFDVLVYPGGQGTRRQLDDAAIASRLRSWHESGVLLASVCTGSLVLAAAGLLRSRAATTHWGSLQRLTEIDPSIEVRPDDRFVDDGDVITASGVSAGIDMALHLVSRLHSVDRAREVRRYIQYDPEPPI
jgi:transcriptional regulator GlxA family with amidase domain